MVDITRMEKMIANGNDSVTLRFAAGKACLDGGDIDRALVHLGRALEMDPEYSAAWKIYARTLETAGRTGEAEEAYTRGIEAADRRGDRQAAREMQVFLKRIRGR